MRILIAEDSASSRFLLEQTLTAFGYTYVSVKNGQEALEAMTPDNAPQLAILDLIMPKLDGIEVCKLIRARNSPNPPYIILLTALGEKENIVMGLEAGANDYIHKPFDNDELHARIRVGERFIDLQNKLSKRIQELQEAIEHIKTLQGIIPICMYCHKIRNDNEAWEKIEQYLEENTGVKLSHGLCPECMDKYYPEEKNP